MARCQHKRGPERGQSMVINRISSPFNPCDLLHNNMKIIFLKFISKPQWVSVHIVIILSIIGSFHVQFMCQLIWCLMALIQLFNNHVGMSNLQCITCHSDSQRQKGKPHDFWCARLIFKIAMPKCLRISQWLICVLYFSITDVLVLVLSYSVKYHKSQHQLHLRMNDRQLQD